MESMIFHAPFAVRPGGASASANRPYQMREAFKRIGYDVFDLSGDGAQRKAILKKLQSEMARGKKFSFAYSESANIPLILSEKKHFPFRPFLDRKIMCLLKKHEIPLGTFYRDIYWRTDLYTKAVGPTIAAIMGVLFKSDLKKYIDSSRIIYLPSIEMADYLPELSEQRIEELPPGAFQINSKMPSYLSLLYVGGLGEHYQLNELVKAAKNLGIKMTLCIPEASWASSDLSDAVAGAKNIKIVHKVSNELDELYDSASVCLITVEPSKYWEFAVPVKLYEYAGHGKPIISSSGTKSAQIVSDNNIGWIVENDSHCYEDLLKRLSTNPEEIAKKTPSVAEFMSTQTWEDRAKKVAAQLTE